MKKLQGESYKTILKLNEGIEIKVNINNWIIFLPPRNYYYFATLEDLLNFAFDYYIKLNLISNSIKDISSLKAALKESKSEISKIISCLTVDFDSPLVRSQMKEATLSGKCD